LIKEGIERIQSTFKNLRLWANIMLGMGIAITLAIAALTYDNLHSMH